VCLGQVIQQQQNWLDDQTIIWMFALRWYCHWWVKVRNPTTLYNSTTMLPNPGTNTHMSSTNHRWFVATFRTLHPTQAMVKGQIANRKYTQNSCLSIPWLIHAQDFCKLKWQHATGFTCHCDCHALGKIDVLTTYLLKCKACNQ